MKVKIATVPVPLDQWEACTPEQFLGSCADFPKDSHQNCERSKQIAKWPPNFHLEVIASAQAYSTKSEMFFSLTVMTGKYTLLYKQIICCFIKL